MVSPVTSVKHLSGSNFKKSGILIPISEITPIKPHRLFHHLRHIGYDPVKTNKLVSGFSEGFYLHHEGPPVDIMPKNGALVTHPEVISKSLFDDIALNRVAGPYDEKPFETFQVSPVNARQKKNSDKHRMIHNLRYPYDKTSINANIPDSAKSVKYASIHDAISYLMNFPRASYMCKTDIRDAYKLIPVHASEYPKLGIYFQGRFYFQRTLPQGCSSSCAIFEMFATALEAIFKYYSSGGAVVHFLDDFFFITVSEVMGCAHMRLFQDICDDIGVPLATHKTTHPQQTEIFLGITLDSIKQQARLPLDKLSMYKASLIKSKDDGVLSHKELESLVGKLSFASSVVPARAFLRRLIDLVHADRRPNFPITLSKETIADMETWVLFLENYNGVTFFRSQNIIPSSHLRMASDSSMIGYGATYGPSWIQGRFPSTWQRYHITVLELYPVLLLIATFGHKIRNSSVLFECDNKSVTDIVNKQSSKNKRVMRLVRPLVLLLIEFNIHLKMKHLPGILNILPDKISRFQESPELLQLYNMDQKPVPTPHRFSVKSWRLD